MCREFQSNGGGNLAVVAVGGHVLEGGAGESGREVLARLAAGLARLSRHRSLVVTHGNGPQIGRLFVEGSGDPLDVCVAQTQGSLGYLIGSELDGALSRDGRSGQVAVVLTRVAVDPEDSAWSTPTKPIGGLARDGDSPAGGTPPPPRLVPSPEPVSVVDIAAVQALVAMGLVVVANGGGGIPVVADAGTGASRGAQAVVDKDLSSALLATQLGARSFAVLTDVDGVAVDFGTPAERWLQRATTAELRHLQDAGQFAGGSMGPKVEAAVRFAEATGRAAVIGPARLGVDALDGCQGTVVVPS